MYARRACRMPRRRINRRFYYFSDTQQDAHYNLEQKLTKITSAVTKQQVYVGDFKLIAYNK